MFESYEDRQIKWKLFFVENKIKQKDFAKRYSFNKDQLSQWLAGNIRPTPENENKLIEAMGKENDRKQS